MDKKTIADQEGLQPIKLDTDQLRELERLIDSLKKEIVLPGKKPLGKGTAHEAKQG